MPDLTAAEILARLYNNCDLLKPASAEFYIDCTDHLGCGKSSELQHFVDKLSYHTPLPSHKRFFAIRVDMLEYIDEYDVTPTEILLALISEFAEILPKPCGSVRVSN